MARVVTSNTGLTICISKDAFDDERVLTENVACLKILRLKANAICKWDWLAKNIVMLISCEIKAIKNVLTSSLETFTDQCCIFWILYNAIDDFVNT